MFVHKRPNSLLHGLWILLTGGSERSDTLLFVLSSFWVLGLPTCACIMCCYTCNYQLTCLWYKNHSIWRLIASCEISHILDVNLLQSLRSIITSQDVGPFLWRLMLGSASFRKASSFRKKTFREGPLSKQLLRRDFKCEGSYAGNGANIRLSSR